MAQRRRVKKAALPGTRTGSARQPRSLFFPPIASARFGKNILIRTKIKHRGTADAVYMRATAKAGFAANPSLRRITHVTIISPNGSVRTGFLEFSPGPRSTWSLVRPGPKDEIIMVTFYRRTRQERRVRQRRLDYITTSVKGDLAKATLRSYSAIGGNTAGI